MHQYRPLLFSIASGLLLWASWPVSPLTLLIFFAFVPLIWITQTVSSRLRFFGLTYLTLLIWNVGTTWWVCYATVPGGIAAMLANSLLMCIPWMGYYMVNKRFGRSAGYVALLAFWLTFEYIHLNWELSWPWLTLGNVFASHPGWIQWYEYTGSSGGSLWIMVVNILLASCVSQYFSKTTPGINTPGKNDFVTSGKHARRYLLYAITSLCVPFIISFIIASGEHKEIDSANQNRAGNTVIVVQPNIDPYQKFEEGMQEGQLKTLITLTEKELDTSKTLVIWPETALNLPSGIQVDYIDDNPYLMPLRTFLAAHPNLSLLTGVEGVRFFTTQNKTEYAIPIANSGSFYESYNAAALVDRAGVRQLYNKSKLVPGVETLPSFLRIISKWFEKFGGTTGGYTPQKIRTVIKDSLTGFSIAPAICYESIYGEFLAKYIIKDANIISIITNDGWWSNTSGHKQHMQYARLRAIETRRWIARSANTGISCFISPVGEILDPQGWDTAASIKMRIPQLQRITFFVRFGDLISWAAIVIAATIIVWSSYQVFKKRRRKSFKYE